MLTESQISKIFKTEITYHTSRSGGKGGQNVNKVETKVELSFDVAQSETLSEEQKTILLHKYHDFIDTSLIKVSSSKYRSQLENKEDARSKLRTLLIRLLKPAKKRIATKPTKASKLKNLLNKKKQGEKKQFRRKPDKEL